MRGRRRQASHTESLTAPVMMLGRCRSSNVLAPIRVLANRSTMYRFMPCTIDTTAIRNVTPISTPISEKKLLSFWARMVRNAMPTASSRRMLGGRTPREAVAFDPAVAEYHHPLGVRRDVGFVGHHDHGLAGRVEVGEHPHDLLAGDAVEVPGGLVRQEDGGIVHQRARDRHSLALTAGELVGPVVHPTLEAHSRQRGGGALPALPAADAGVHQR